MLLLEAFSNINDPRRNQAKAYQIDVVLTFAILAILSGASSYRKIYWFINSHFPRFKKIFKLKWKSPPSYGTIRNIIISVDSNELEQSFREFTKCLQDSLCKVNELLKLSIDGKVLRGSFDHFKDEKAIQMLSVFCSNTNLILAHEKIEDKTNEIPVAQALMDKMKFTNCLLTFDALNCQIKTIDAAILAKHHIIVQVKGNQKKLLDNCKEIALNNIIIDEHTQNTEKGHAKIVNRTAKVFQFVDNTANQSWKNVKNIIWIQRNVLKYNTKTKQWDDTSETSCYISTIELQANEFNLAIRQHWGVENKNHNVRDVAMKEDASRIRIKPQNMAILRSFPLNILRYNKKSNISQELYNNSLNVNKLLKLKAILKNLN